MNKETLLKTLKYDILKSMLERCDQLEKDVKSFEEEINNANSQYEISLIELKNSSIKCFNDYWALIIDMCKKDEEYQNALNYLMPRGQTDYVYRELNDYFKNKSLNSLITINNGIKNYNLFHNHCFEASENVKSIFEKILKDELVVMFADVMKIVRKI